MAVDLVFLSSPSEFLAAAGEWLAREPVVGTVVATMAHRGAGAERLGQPLPDGDWWLVVRDGGAPVGVAMRQAPFAPRPLFLLPMPDEAAVALARALVARGEVVEALNGALPATRVCADEIARLTGRSVRVAIHSRLHSATRVVRPEAPEGALRPASVGELPRVLEWFAAFFADADAQAGRPAGSHTGEVPPPLELLRRISDGEIWVWERDATPVHVSALNPASFGVARIGPVFTPQEHRGHGYAAATVAALTERALEAGDVPCLFTDQANPVSNALYARIGYEPVVDMVNLVLSSG